MTATPQLLTADHIDLLTTAALRWRILTDLTTAAFTPAESHLVVATATEAARILQQENLAALRWLSDRGRSRLADRAVPDRHLFSEVDALDPVEVIKACHAAQYLCSPAPGWAGSTAHRLLAAVSTAATHPAPRVRRGALDLDPTPGTRRETCRVGPAVAARPAGHQLGVSG